MIKVPFMRKFFRKPVGELSEFEKGIIAYDEALAKKEKESYGKPIRWIKASDIKPDDEWMQENEWDEIYKQESEVEE